VTLTASHSEAQVQLLLEGLADCHERLGPEPGHA
jgi:8-amino-7-oxononanoate synthase